MKGIVCQVCGFVALDGVAPANCPVCHSPKEAFQEKEEALKTAQDPKNLTELEKKHIPVILVEKKCGLLPGTGCVDVHVKLGEVQHPMIPEHFIGRIDFYVDKKFAARVILTPEKLNPAAGLHLKESRGTLSVVENCNIHGTWIREIAL